PFVTLPTLLELGVPLVGYGTYSVPDAYPSYIAAEQLAGLEFVGNQTPSLERIAELQPDLIIGSYEFADTEDAYAQLSQIAPTVPFRLRTAKGEWKETVTAIAAAVRQEQ